MSSSDLDIVFQTMTERLQMPLLTLQSSSFVNQSPPLFQSHNLSFRDDKEEYNEKPDPKRAQIAREESKLEKEIIRTILTGETEDLKPNSGQAVSIGDHHICVGYHDDSTSDYRIWEWHGHIMLIDELNGYTPEYIYGNYIDKLALKPINVKTNIVVKKMVDENEEKTGSLGLKELIGSINSCGDRVLHAGSLRNNM